jgi:radical SAM protein with 4Fe4S-binding SPASM domain
MSGMRKEALRFPKSVSIETYSLCNGRCVFCPYEEMNLARTTFALKNNIVQQIIDEAAENNVQKLVFYVNNEPILDKRIIKFIKYAKREMPKSKLIFSSNGRNLTASKIIELVNSGINSLSITIPALDNEYYKSLMKYDISKIISLFEEIPSNIYQYIRVATPLTHYYSKEEFTKMFEKQGIEVCAWDIEANTMWTNFHDITKICDLRYGFGCDRPLDSAFISSNGDVIICCRDWKHNNVIGNIYESTLGNIWSGSEMKRIQQLVIRQQFSEIECCKNCTRSMMTTEANLIEDCSEKL